MHRTFSCMLLVQSLRRVRRIAFDPRGGSVSCLHLRVAWVELTLIRAVLSKTFAQRQDTDRRAGEHARIGREHAGIDGGTIAKAGDTETAYGVNLAQRRRRRMRSERPLVPYPVARARNGGGELTTHEGVSMHASHQRGAGVTFG